MADVTATNEGRKEVECPRGEGTRALIELVVSVSTPPAMATTAPFFISLSSLVNRLI